MEDYDDHVVLIELVLQLDQAGHRGPRRIAGEYPFLPRDAPRHQGGVLVRDLLEMVDHAEVTFFGRKSSPMPSVMYG